MALYRRGSKGPEVSRIQARLKELGYYLGPIDADFGGGTESAVRAFQRARQLDVDGQAGPKTWAALFGEVEITEPAIVNKPLAYRCLGLTGSFETNAPIPECFAGLSGDFDGQGISFGACQWNLGQGSLQPLLREMDRTHPDVLETIFDEHLPVLRALLRERREEQLNWARSIQNQRLQLMEPWRGLFKTLGRREEFQNIQVEAAGHLHQAALKLCETYGVRSERAVALMFDIQVQNGGVNELVRAQIEQDFKGLEQPGDWEAEEVSRLRVIANRRAEAANPRWVEDVRVRKLTIANGEGTVHGGHYNLSEQYGIRLRPFAES